MRKATVPRLKSRLSAYLADVRSGDSVVIYDRSTPIARLVPYDPTEVDDFEVIRAVGSPENLKRIRPIRLRTKIDVVRLLRQDRDAN